MVESGVRFRADCDLARFLVAVVVNLNSELALANFLHRADHAVAEAESVIVAGQQNAVAFGKSAGTVIGFE